MPVNLSLHKKSSTGSFYTKIHLSMRDNMNLHDLPPTTMDFNLWMENNLPDVCNLNILDAGCGAHAFLSIIAKKMGARNVVSLDLNTEATSFLKGNYPEMDITRGSVLSLPFKDATFDFCICSGVLHHLPDPTAGIRELFRVLRPGGGAYILLYCSRYSLFEFFTRLLRLLGRIIPFDAIHKRFHKSPLINNFILDNMYVPILWLYSAKEVFQLFSEIGFEVLDDFVSSHDVFQRLPMRKQLTGDGICRVFILRKK